MALPTRSTLTVGVVALVLGAALVGAGVVLAGGGNGTGPSKMNPATDGPGGKSITVSASGEAGAEPDRALVRVSVEATADDPTVARQRVAENVSSMREALLDLGLAEDAIRTTGFDIYEDRVRPSEPGAEPETTYRARHSFVVEVADTARVGEVIDTAVDGGATSVHGVEFTLASETRDRLRGEAIQSAMTNAREQADVVAASADLSIVDVRSASTGSVGGPGPVVRMEAAAGDGGGGTELESGPVTVTATVTVTYNATG